MKTRTFLTTALLCFVAMTARAQTSLNNANTPEAFIGQCPDLLGAGVLAACHQPDASDEPIRIFHDNIDRLRKRYKEVKAAAQEQSKDNLMPVADKQVRELTGRSLAEVQQMSDSELEAMGHKKANSMLKKLGIKKSAKELEKEGMSEAEQQQMAESMMKQMSGLSMKEAQALQNMSEAEQMAYMQQAGRMDRLEQSAAKVAATQPVGISAGNAESLTEITKELRKMQEQWSYIDDVYEREKLEMIDEMVRIIAKYQAQMPPESGKILDKWFGTVLLTYHTKEEQRVVNRLRLACDTECFTLWRNLISKRQGQLKIRLTDCHRADKLAARQRELQGMAVEIPMSSALGLVEDYLELTASSTSLPSELWDRYDAKTETPQTDS